MKILIVDDSKHARLIAQSIILPLEAEIRECADGSAAISILRTWAADVVLVDYEMRPMDGPAFVSALRQLERQLGRRTGVLMMTGHVDEQHVYAARAAGIDGLVAKPLTAGGLLSRLEQVVRRNVELSGALKAKQV